MFKTFDFICLGGLSVIIIFIICGVTFVASLNVNISNNDSQIENRIIDDYNETDNKIVIKFRDGDSLIITATEGLRSNIER